MQIYFKTNQFILNGETNWVAIKLLSLFAVALPPRVGQVGSPNPDWVGRIYSETGQTTCGSGGPHPNSTTILKNLTLEVRANLR